MDAENDFYRRNQKWLLLALLVLSYFLFLHRVGDRDIWNPDEDEYALVNREMVEDGNWIYPTQNGEPYNIKPPLFNWLGSLVSLAYGEVNEFTSRVPSVAAGMAGVFLIYFLGRLLFGVRAGFLAALVLATTPLYIEFSRWIQINMISTVLLVLTLFFFYWGYTNERRRTLAYLLMFVPMGLGTLNMGPVNLVMPAICVFFYLVAVGDLRHAFTKRFILTMLGGLLVYFVVVGPWYVTVCLREEYRDNLLFFTNLTRYFGEFAHARPFYYYFLTTPGYFLPWVLFLPPLAYVCYTDVPGEERQRLRGSVTGVMSFFRAVFGLIVAFARTADGKKLLFPLMWAGSLFLFFSFSKTKRSEYMLPIFPALALLVGYFLDRAFRQAKESAFWRKSITWPVYGVLAAFALAAVALPIVAAVLYSEWIALVLPLSGILLVGSGFTCWLLRRRPGVPVVAALSCVIAASVAYAAGSIIVKANEDESSRHFCSVVREKTSGDDRIKMYKCYHAMYPYYTRKLADKAFEPAELEAWLRSEERVYIIMKERHYKQVKDTFPVPLHLAHREWIDHRYMVLVSNRPDA